MFRAKTVFVLGAGASAEVGLPVGTGLLNKIVDLVNIKYQHNRMTSGDHVVSEALQYILQESAGEFEKYNSHLHAAWQLIDSSKQALSIDNVIDGLEDEKVELVGKIAIVRAILEAERNSKFFRPPANHHGGIDLSIFDGTWYSHFAKLLSENVKRSEIGSIFHNLEIVNFNYDRCIENYLPYSISKYYGIPLQDVQKLMHGLKIHRPYGKAGRLPWEEGGQPSLEFGSGNFRQIADASQQIRTFTERLDDGVELNDIKHCISDAERIVFLGFAFHRQNLEILSSAARSNVEILATTYDISNSDQKVIDKELLDAFALSEDGKMRHKYVEMASLTCTDFFKNYWRTLTSGSGDEPYDALEAIANTRPIVPAMHSFPRLNIKKS